MRYQENIFEVIGMALDERSAEIKHLNWRIEELKDEIDKLRKENELLKGNSEKNIIQA